MSEPMTFEQAVAKLISFDDLISQVDDTASLAKFASESDASRKLRTELLIRHRDMAQRIAHDTSISDLEFTLIMNRLTLEDIRTLAQLQLSETE